MHLLEHKYETESGEILQYLRKLSGVPEIDHVQMDAVMACHLRNP
jgi:hypothetical protein